MSKPFLFKYGKNYNYVFTNPKTNKRSRLSCNTGDYNEALKYITSDEFKARYNELTSTTSVLETVCSNTGIVKYKISDLIPEMNKYSETNHKRDSKLAYKKLFEKLIDVLGEDRYLNDITTKDMELFKQKRSVNGSKASCNLNLRCLKAAFNLAILWKMMDSNPCIGIKQHKLPKRIHQVFTDEQIGLILSKCSQDWLKDMIIVSLYTGVRLGELLTLRFRNIDLGNNVITISNYEDFTTKSSKDREVPIFPELNPHIIRLLKITFDNISKYKVDYLFVDNNKSKFNGCYVSHKFKALLRLCNIPEELHFHNLRHTFATNCISNGISEHSVQKMLGHNDIQTTINSYTHLSSRNIQNQITGKQLYKID